MPFPPEPCHPEEGQQFKKPEVGMRVMIYEDPLICEKPEGVALITAELGNYRFIVEFDGDDGEYERTIYDESLRRGVAGLARLATECAKQRGFTTD